MRPKTHRARLLRRVVVGALLGITLSYAHARAAEKTVSRDTARKVIARVGGLELKKGDVQVERVSGTGAAAEVAATIKTAFRLRKDAAGQWRVVEVRVGDRQWEEIELLLSAWGGAQPAPLIAQLETLTAQLVARERARAAEKKQSAAEEQPTGAQPAKQDKKKPPPAPAEEDPRAGPFVVKSFSTLLSAATVEARLDMTFRLSKDGRGQWRVTEARLGDGPWVDPDALARTLDAAKATRARADLAALAAAIEAFRRERGFYVVAETSVALIDQLSPHYLPAVIRLDPWHRPYAYVGTTNRYTLRSLGPDGKPDTPDDVTSANGSR